MEKIVMNPENETNQTKQGSETTGERVNKINVKGNDYEVADSGGNTFTVKSGEEEVKTVFFSGGIEELIKSSPFILDDTYGSFYTASKPHLYFSIKGLSVGSNSANETAKWNTDYEGFEKSSGHKRGIASAKSETFVLNENREVVINPDNVGHEIIASERPVYMAGTMMHSKGKLIEWYNNSGHYLPVGEGALSITELKIPGRAWK